MSDGVEAEGKRVEQNNKVASRDEHNNKGDSRNEQNKAVVQSGSNNFGRAISRIIVAQICENIGFEGFNGSTLDSFTDIAIRFLCDFCKTTKFYVDLAGRAECNVFDVIQGLEDLGISQGFSGASKIHAYCIVSSGAVREIKEYVARAEEIEFAQPVPQFPVVRKPGMIPSFMQMGENPSLKHIPAWLPAFPDPHTYIRTPVWNERVSDPRTDKIELARQQRKAERSLLSLQQRLLCNGLTVTGTSAVPEDGENGLEASKMGNPFLAEPLQGGGRVPPINLPSKLSGTAKKERHSSLLETFAPAIEAMKDDLDSGSDGERILPEKRSSVFLEFNGGKKVFGEPLDLRIRNKAPGKTASWFGREEERDDKKRRVEFVLRQSLENQQELPQL